MQTWRECMISIAIAAMSYYALRLQGAERDWWARWVLSLSLYEMSGALDWDIIDREAVL